ncbi:DMT family transporter [Methanobacterium sp. MBAC-LM]|uniref:DMT family transporter n=1 Tax=Methanobacterium sp. MBAC-LM TaxID=3412034 RepID=UPI003C71C452
MNKQQVGHIKNNGTLLVITGLILTNIFWGASGVAVKVAQLQLGTFEIVALRFIAAMPLLILATVLWKGWNALKIDKKDLPYIAILAFLGIPLEFLLQVTSLAYTTATCFTLIFSLSPFFIIFASAVLIKEKITRHKAIGALIGFIGVTFIITNGSLAVPTNLLGDAIAIMANIVWALYTVLGKSINEKYSALTVLNYTFIFGALELLPFYFISPRLSPAAFTETTWIAMIFLTIFCSLVAFLLYNYGTEKLPASIAGMFIYVQPLSGVALAAIVLGESITIYTILGTFLIIYGIYEAERRGGLINGIKNVENNRKSQ